MFWAKVYVLKYDTICAICDKEILGKIFKFKGVEIKISERFYKGEMVDKDRAVKIMKNSNIGNLFGKRIVELAIKEKIIDRRNVLLINKIPHAQFLK